MEIDVSFHAQHAAVAIAEAAAGIESAMTAPHVLMRPSLAPDGNMWSALYGPSLAEGVCGFGETPAAAMADFDKKWREQRLRTPHVPNEPTSTGRIKP
jgi:hypothetical protein